MTQKHGSKENFYKTQEQMKKKRLEEDEDYTHLYKKLADDHENKDVRKKVVKKLTATKEGQLSPTLGLNFNPAYRMEQNNQTTTFRQSFTGDRKEEVDKLYFRKRDGLAAYAEALFKFSVISSKK
jgi:hypothetical protein